MTEGCAVQVTGSTSWAGSRGDMRLLARLGLSQAGLQDERDAEEKALAAKNRWRRKSSSQGQSKSRPSLPCMDIWLACVQLESLGCAVLCCAALSLVLHKRHHVPSMVQVMCGMGVSLYECLYALPWYVVSGLK